MARAVAFEQGGEKAFGKFHAKFGDAAVGQMKPGLDLSHGFAAVVAGNGGALDFGKRGEQTAHNREIIRARLARFGAFWGHREPASGDVPGRDDVWVAAPIGRWRVPGR
jgi:hypothetical protein